MSPVCGIFVVNLSFVIISTMRVCLKEVKFFFGVGATICTCREIQCLLYAGFLVFVLFIRPGVAEADLQTAMPLSQSVGQSCHE